jgi:hypothetical protein
METRTVLQYQTECVAHFLEHLLFVSAGPDYAYFATLHNAALTEPD